jgi:hypothetical protein
MVQTSKSKATSNPKKSSGTAESVKSNKVTTSKAKPTEDQIREKAKEIYHQRILRGEKGTAVDDWNKAEKILKGS